MGTTFKTNWPTPLIRNCWIGLFMVSGLIIADWAEADQYEVDTITFSVSALLDENVRSGPHYRIGETVTNEGFMNHYKVESDFGLFNAASDEEVLLRIGEVAAIAELESLRKTDVFAQAVGQAAQKPVQAIQKVVEQPVETIKGIPAGVGRLFKRTKRIIKDAGETLEEYSNEQNQQSGSGTDKQQASTQEVLDQGVEEGKKYTMRKLGHSSAIRKLARDLKVDPYSSNKILQKEMSDVAWAMAAGSLTTGLVLPSMPGGFSELSDINDLVWNTDPLDLRLRNEELLKGMGVSESLTKLFYENKYFTTTTQTRLIGSLNLLSAAKGKPILIANAVTADSTAEARLFGQIVETLVAYQQSRSPIVRILDGSIWPFAQSKNGNLVYIVPLDYLSWTQNVDEAARRLTAELKKISGDSKREMWIQGKVSDMARTNLEALGWDVFAQSKQRL